jgi:hypothetical protein
MFCAISFISSDSKISHHNCLIILNSLGVNILGHSKGNAYPSVVETAYETVAILCPAEYGFNPVVS